MFDLPSLHSPELLNAFEIQWSGHFCDEKPLARLHLEDRIAIVEKYKKDFMNFKECPWLCVNMRCRGCSFPNCENDKNWNVTNCVIDLPKKFCLSEISDSKFGLTSSIVFKKNDIVGQYHGNVRHFTHFPSEKGFCRQVIVRHFNVSTFRDKRVFLYYKVIETASKRPSI